MADGSTAHSIAAFTALGTIVGYLGTEAATVSTFTRLLWPSRYYNDLSMKSLLGAALLMPTGGPIHKAAVEALERFLVNGLWRGYCQGDMLNTPFYEDTGARYVIHLQSPASEREERIEDARNGFWFRVMSLVPWLPPSLPAGSDPSNGGVDGEVTIPRVENIRSRRPVSKLLLCRRPRSNLDDGQSVIDGDIDSPKWRHLIAIVASETITLAFGFTMAIYWQSLFALWFLIPLVLKLVAAASAVRRHALEPPPKRENDKESIEEKKKEEGDNKNPRTPDQESDWPSDERDEEDDVVVCEAVSFTKGFFLIQGPSELVFQFFRHYGHPERSRRGLRGDRMREVISMVVAILYVLVYPSGLLLFIYSPPTIQWVWLSYQVYTMIAMNIYRVFGGDSIGTTESWVARQLGEKGQVYFNGGNGNRIIARLEEMTIVNKVDEGRSEVKRLLNEVLKGKDLAQ